MEKPQGIMPPEAADRIIENARLAVEWLQTSHDKAVVEFNKSLAILNQEKSKLDCAKLHLANMIAFYTPQSSGEKSS